MNTRPGSSRRRRSTPSEFILDEDVYASTERLLKSIAPSVQRITEILPPGSSDEAVWKTVIARQSVFITRDKGFALRWMRTRLKTPAVILLRISPQIEKTVHGRLEFLLRNLDGPWSDCIISVNDRNFRVRRR